MSEEKQSHHVICSECFSDRLECRACDWVDDFYTHNSPETIERLKEEVELHKGYANTLGDALANTEEKLLETIVELRAEIERLTS